MMVKRNSSWSHLTGLQLADPNYIRKGSIDVLLGVGGDWDVELPTAEEKSWKDWYSTLVSIKDIQIPRWIGYTPTHRSIQLHGFADALLRAYGAVAYLRVENKTETTVQLIVARS